jgi:(2R)-sulfolactate sulfo-lyase subunit alpha
LSENGAPSRHKFLIHKRGDHVGVATADISSGERVQGIFMDDDSAIEVEARADIPVGHKIAIEPLPPEAEVLEYGIRIGRAPGGFELGDYVHTHNIKSARW